MIKVEIGNATLYNGDCVEATELIKEFDHCITDPPYEAGAHTATRQVMTAEGLVVQAHDFDAMDEVTRDKITKAIAEKTKKWSLIFCQNEGAHFWREALRVHGIKPYSTMVWCKPDGKPNYNGTGPGVGYEAIVASWCGEGKSIWNGGGKCGIFIINKNEERTEGNIHTTIKPQKLMRELIGLFTSEHETIFDCFMGSGSTGVAAVSMGRKFIGVERDPKYFETCVKRIEEAQKGFFHVPYVKTKAKVLTSLLAEPPATAKAKPQRKLPPPIAKGPLLAKKTRFSTPTIILGTAAAPRKAEPEPEPENDGKIVTFDDATWAQPERSYAGLDVECYVNFFCANFKRFNNGKRISLELSERSELNKQWLSEIMLREGIVTFNGLSYDLPMIYLALRGAGNNELKHASDHLIRDKVMPWHVEKELGIKIPRAIDHIDLFESNPSIRDSLKTLNGRLHGKIMRDLPYPPDAVLTRPQMNNTVEYCFNDLDATHLLFTAMREPLILRTIIGKEYGMDMRSKSDAQVGEAIVKKRVEQASGTRIKKSDDIPNSFRYTTPSFLTFKNEQINKAIDIVNNAEFYLNAGGHTEMPDELENLVIKIGSGEYRMGLGGLHSSESHRAVFSDDEYVLIAPDVASQYPAIILKLGMYPKAIGPKFLDIFGKIFSERLAAKEQLKIKWDKALQNKIDSFKIVLNGVYGKLGSHYSTLYAPEIMIAITLTGQLSLLMLIEKIEEVGISVVSGNTDGLVIRCPRDREEEIALIIAEWEEETGFQADVDKYKAIYNSSVNSYIAIKESGKVVLKGPHGNPWAENDLRSMMKKNPQMTICSNAVVKYITDKIPIEETIKDALDVREFITIINVKGGATWRGKYLGKVVRYYWSTDGDPILYVTATKKGTHKKVSNSDGSRELMTLPDQLPSDIDYERYIKEAKDLAIDLAVITEGFQNDTGI